jgi:hypothetical protein
MTPCVQAGAGFGRELHAGQRYDIVSPAWTSSTRIRATGQRTSSQSASAGR